MYASTILPGKESMCTVNGHRREITCLRGVVNNTGAADQPAPLLFAFWKESYVNLLQVKFQIF